VATEGPAADPFEFIESQEDVTEPLRRRIPLSLELPLLIAASLIAAVLMKTFLFAAFYIPSISMQPTLEVQDRIMVNKLLYDFRPPRAGEIVVFDNPLVDGPEGDGIKERVAKAVRDAFGLRAVEVPDDFIKRIIGLGGDVVEISNGVVTVNGTAIDEPYLHPDTQMCEFGPVTVPEGELFLMGDNRNSSGDSRVFGTRPIEDVIGKAFVLIWPFDRVSRL
jgi:signal peptidase I